MNGLPSFLARPNKPITKIDNLANDGYQPLLAVWLIELMLMTGAHHKMARGGRHLFDDEDEIAKLTGLNIEKCEGLNAEESELRINGKRIPMKSGAIAKELGRHVTLYRNQPISDDLHVFANLDMLAGLLCLSRVEQAVLCFVAMLQINPLFKSAIGWMGIRTSQDRFAELIGYLTGNEKSDVATALLPDSVLRASGIIEVSDHRADIDDWLELLSGFGVLLSQPYQSAEIMVGKFLKKCDGAMLSQSDYPHLKQDTTVLSSYLATAINNREPGCNVLLHGIPGTGKTEFAKVLAAKLGADLYEVSFSNEDGDPIRGNARLRAYNLCQRILANRGNALLIFDEIEDVFPARGFWQMMLSDLGDDENGGRGSAKAWINRVLEKNRTPAIWITNDANIDLAYLRRFDYSVRFVVPPLEVRKEIVRHHLGQFDPSEEWLAKVAANEQYTPAQYDRAAKVARLCAPCDAPHALLLAEQALDRSASLLGQKIMPTRNILHTCYDLKYTNTSLPLERILDGLNKRRTGTFCFYGPAGTGKSEFARHISDRLGMPCIVRRVSDILSKWVGDSEKHISGMFAEARQQEAMLVLDEADSFLADRRDARHGWEITQVNELLTQMEAFDGIFVCTTNLMERLDQASLRRFAFKVKFDYLNSDQRWEMFQQELERLGGDLPAAGSYEGAVRGLERLTPGDFAVAARQFRVYGETATADALLAQIKEECLVKGGNLGRMGF